MGDNSRVTPEILIRVLDVDIVPGEGVREITEQIFADGDGNAQVIPGDPLLQPSMDVTAEFQVIGDTDGVDFERLGNLCQDRQPRPQDEQDNRSGFRHYIDFILSR